MKYGKALSLVLMFIAWVSIPSGNLFASIILSGAFATAAVYWPSK